MCVRNVMFFCYAEARRLNAGAEIVSSAPPSLMSREKFLVTQLFYSEGASQ